MHSSISREFSFFSLLRFTFPTIVMMVFLACYTVVDGIFVSRFIGTDALSAINITVPVINLVYAIAIMLGTGGNALIARKMGEHDMESAKNSLSLIVAAGLAAGAFLVVVGILFLDPMVRLMGANDALAPYCTDYLRILILFIPAGILQGIFQSFFVTAGKPGLGMLLTIIGGVANIVLDYVFIVPMNMGIAGAALGTGVSYLIPAVAGLVFFRKKKNPLHFVRPKMDARALWQTCFNGSSEMVTNLSIGLTTLVMNLIMMRTLGEDGVAAITIVLYGQFLFVALYMGFSGGAAPVISYHYGGQNHAQLQKLFRICLSVILASSALVFILSIALAQPIVSVFSPQGTATYDIALHGFLLFSINYLFAGVNIFASSLYTALSNGKISAFLSFLRTFGFLMICLFTLPFLWKADGIWLAVPIAEFLSLLFSIYFLKRGGSEYHYFRGKQPNPAKSTSHQTDV